MKHDKEASTELIAPRQEGPLHDVSAQQARKQKKLADALKSNLQRRKQAARDRQSA